jgi:hypothetical protein
MNSTDSNPAPSPETEDLGIEDLTDEEAKWTAWAIGIPTWTDRNDLNRQWRELMDSLKKNIGTGDVAEGP